MYVRVYAVSDTYLNLSTPITPKSPVPATPLTLPPNRPYQTKTNPQPITKKLSQITKKITPVNAAVGAIKNSSWKMEEVKSNLLLVILRFSRFCFFPISGFWVMRKILKYISIFVCLDFGNVILFR